MWKKIEKLLFCRKRKSSSANHDENRDKSSNNLWTRFFQQTSSYYCCCCCCFNRKRASSSREQTNKSTTVATATIINEQQTNKQVDTTLKQSLNTPEVQEIEILIDSNEVPFSKNEFNNNLTTTECLNESSEQQCIDKFSMQQQQQQQQQSDGHDLLFHSVPLQAQSEKSSSSFLSNFFSKRAKIAIANSNSPNSFRENTNLANRRLMKELSDLMKRPKSETCDFTVETINDLLSEWFIKIYNFDPDSQISRDMKQHDVEYVKLHAIFPLTYPFEPPFLRVVSPYIDRGFVVEGGAICLELLTKKGWTSAYTMELVIVQLMASFVKGQARLKPNKDPARCFTKKHAQNAFNHIVRVHNKHGWVDSES